MSCTCNNIKTTLVWESHCPKPLTGILPQRSRGRDPLEAAIWRFEEFFHEFNIQLHMKRNNAPALTFTISSLVK